MLRQVKSHVCRHLSHHLVGDLGAELPFYPWKYLNKSIGLEIITFRCPFAHHGMKSSTYDYELIRIKWAFMWKREWGILSQNFAIYFTDSHIRISTSNITVTGRTSVGMIFQSPVSNLRRENAQSIQLWRYLLLWGTILTVLQFNLHLSNGHTAWTIIR